MKNFYCLLVKQFQVPAKHFFLKNIYLSVAKGLQFSHKGKRKESVVHTRREAWVSVHTTQSFVKLCQWPQLFDENMKERSNR